MNLSISIRAWFRHPIRWVKTIFSLQHILIFLLVTLFSAFVAVMFSETVEKCAGQLLGLGLSEANEKNKILTFLGIGMGGILLALQAVIANRRAKAMENAAKEQVKANENTEQGQRQERLKNAIEHLGHKSDSVRLGGAYELFHLAEDTKELRQTVLDILCAHIRRTTGENEYRETHKSKPSEEIQSLLTLIFVQEHEVFKGLYINLQESWLNGADLREARLSEIDLWRAHLRRTNLLKADLRGTELIRADLRGALLGQADLREANSHFVCLQGAYLDNADMRGATLIHADMRGANLNGVDLQKAHLACADLRGTNLCDATLRGADLTCGKMQGAILKNTNMQGTELFLAHFGGATSGKQIHRTFAERIRNSIGKNADLSSTVFEGGLTEENIEIAVRDLPENTATALREELEAHIGKPKSNQLAERHDTNTECYTKEEAEEWITEYEEAMSMLPNFEDKR